MSHTDLYLLVETPYMGHTDPIWLEQVLIYGSSVKSSSGKVPYIWVVSQVNFWKGSLHMGCRSSQFLERFLIYMEPQSVYFWWEVHIAVLWVSELILWVSELILWVSELVPLYFGCLNLILWASEDQAFWYDP